MTGNGNRTLRAHDGSTRAPKRAYQPTRLFLKYLTLVQATQVASDDANVETVIAERDRVTEELARKRARNIGEVFEKIYVWRMESFDPGDTGFIYFDDIFPLSVYFDLKRLIKFDGAASEMDRLLEDHLRGAAEEPSMEDEEPVCHSTAPFEGADPSKIH
jgi:hypothetical protein